jgi:hypothetical protein
MQNPESNCPNLIRHDNHTFISTATEIIIIITITIIIIITQTISIIHTIVTRKVF